MNSETNTSQSIQDLLHQPSILEIKAPVDILGVVFNRHEQANKNRKRLRIIQYTMAGFSASLMLVIVVLSRFMVQDSTKMLVTNGIVSVPDSKSQQENFSFEITPNLPKTDSANLQQASININQDNLTNKTLDQVVNTNSNNRVFEENQKNGGPTAIRNESENLGGVNNKLFVERKSSKKHLVRGQSVLDLPHTENVFEYIEQVFILTGKITNEKMVPIASANIDARYGHILLTAQSDANGIFSLELPEAGTYTIELNKTDHLSTNDVLKVDKDLLVYEKTYTLASISSGDFAQITGQIIGLSGTNPPYQVCSRATETSTKLSCQILTNYSLTNVNFILNTYIGQNQVYVTNNVGTIGSTSVDIPKGTKSVSTQINVNDIANPSLPDSKEKFKLPMEFMLYPDETVKTISLALKSSLGEKSCNSIESCQQVLIAEDTEYNFDINVTGSYNTEYYIKTAKTFSKADLNTYYTTSGIPQSIYIKLNPKPFTSRLDICIGPGYFDHYVTMIDENGKQLRPKILSKSGQMNQLNFDNVNGNEKLIINDISNDVGFFIRLPNYKYKQSYLRISNNVAYPHSAFGPAKGAYDVIHTGCPLPIVLQGYSGPVFFPPVQ